uniref:Uncharacterized protein n=1 Tax=Rhizophora mucronata TaxID=61149 RepID=A0A2P2L8A0_RHIMU
MEVTSWNGMNSFFAKELFVSTLATAFGGKSLFSLGSTHCFTLSSLNLGVACGVYLIIIIRCTHKGRKDN